MSGGDGMEGLALAIALASSCMLLVPALLLGGVGYFVFRKKGAVFAALAGLVLGGVIGAIAVVATFMESTWDPPLELVLEAPPDLLHRSVFLIEDATASTEIDWSGSGLPMTTTTAHVPIPRSGVLRVRSLERIRTHDRVVRLATGETAWGMAFLNAPPALNATQIMYFDFVPYPSPEPDPSLLSPQDLATKVRAREAE